MARGSTAALGQFLIGQQQILKIEYGPQVKLDMTLVYFLGLTLSGARVSNKAASPQNTTLMIRTYAEQGCETGNPAIGCYCWMICHLFSTK